MSVEYRIQKYDVKKQMEFKFKSKIYNKIIKQYLENSDSIPIKNEKGESEYYENLKLFIQ